MKTKYIGVNLKPSTIKFLREQGEKQGRKLSTEMRFLLEKLEEESKTEK